VVEILKNFEVAAGRFSPPVLVVPGVILAAFGLFIWLNGLRFRRVSLVLAVAIVGVLYVFAMGIGNPAISILPIVVAAALVAVLPRLCTAVLLATLVAAIVFIVLAWPFITGNRAANPRTNLPFSARESLDLARAYGLDLTDNIKRAGQELPSTKWIVAGAVGLALFALGLVFRNAAGAMAYSLLGTILIWAGLMILLMYKGSTPVWRIEKNALAYGLGAVAMIAFAGLEQYLLCRRTARRRKAGIRRKNEEQVQEAKPGWRGE
jgi:hypothetical protein